MDGGYDIFGEITRGIRGYLEANGFKGVQEVVGLAHEA